jgi:hypothetical protein
MSINSLSNKNAPNVVASATLQSNGATEVRKRKKWTMEMNIFIIREYFRITKLQDVVSTYRLTIQNLADQRRVIMKKNYIPSAILENIKKDVKLELSINYSDNNEVSNNLVENSVEPQSLPNYNDSFCYQNNSTPNTIQNDINNLDLSYNDIHVINQNFYYHQNFKEQIEDEFNRTLNEFEHIEPFNRPLLPKQQSSKKFFAMIEILNQFILPKFVNNTSFKKLHSIIYSGALTIIRLNGSKEIDQTNNIKAKELPKWERRLNKRINNIRRDLGRIIQYLKGINSNHLNNCIQSILDNNRIHCLKYNEYNKTLIDSLSPLWFCLAINPLTNLLNSTGYGFNIRHNNTTLSKLNHLLYMDDIKLYASKKNHILSLLTITENFSNDISMSFGIDKCKTQSICRGHYENLEYITKEGEIIKNLNKGEFYKYLGINQSNHIQHSIIKENLEKQFYLRIKSILKSKLNGNNLIVEPNIPDTIANIKQKSLHGRYFKELEQPEINIQASHAWLKKSNIHPETEGFIFAIQDRVINTRNYKKHICGLQSIIDKCRICGTEGETIEHIISSCTVLAQSEYKKRHDIFAKIIHMNLAVKFNLLKDTQPHYIYKPESCLENDNYKLYFDRTVLTDIHIQHNRPDIIILNKQQKQAYLLDIAVPNSNNITQIYNTKINKYLELSVAMRNLWCLEKISILPFIISATGIVPQSLFKNLKILDLENTLVVEIQKGILLYSCHIVRKFLNIDTEHKTQKSQNVEARRR